MGGWVVGAVELGCCGRVVGEVVGGEVDRSLWVCRRALGGGIERVLAGVEGRGMRFRRRRGRAGLRMPWFDLI